MYYYYLVINMLCRHGIKTFSEIYSGSKSEAITCPNLSTCSNFLLAQNSDALTAVRDSSFRWDSRVTGIPFKWNRASESVSKLAVGAKIEHLQVLMSVAYRKGDHLISFNAPCLPIPKIAGLAKRPRVRRCSRRQHPADCGKAHTHRQHHS